MVFECSVDAVDTWLPCIHFWGGSLCTVRIFHPFSSCFVLWRWKLDYDDVKSPYIHDAMAMYGQLVHA